MPIYRIFQNKWWQLALILTAMLFLSACATVAGTGRYQLNLVSDAEINAMAMKNYRSMVQAGPLSTNRKQVAMVKNSGARISKSAEKYLTENGQAADIPNYAWEFNLIDEPGTVNAFCMPGGKVAFYTGIMAICETEAGVATVMGHGVAHAIARHGNERVSQQLAVQGLGVALEVGLGVKGVGGLTGDMVMTAFGVGSQVGVLLPFSRAHESEADRIGLSLMAMAGYDPAESVAFWKRMAAASGGAGGAGVLSTHPTDQKRISDLEKYLPEAKALYVKKK